MKIAFQLKLILLCLAAGALVMSVALAGAPASTKLTGKVIGTPGSYQNGGSTIDKVFDGSLDTFFDAPESTNGNGCWVGLDLGKAVQITKIRFVPRSDFPDRMIGGKFQGSATADFAKPVDLAVVKTSPDVGKWTDITTLLSSAAFQYVRYLSPDDGWGNIAELEFYCAP
ncbi:MAG: discoidin domain-containing protein [Capsulimonadaceae bacterium]|nr:discoidin domain-containing protein [Capsulimonadaceae bacterium]